MARLATLVNLYKDLGGGWIAHTGDTPRRAEDLGALSFCVSNPLNLAFNA
jgi:hypothetical protein